MFGLDNFLYPAPYSLIMSIFLVLGLDLIGSRFFQLLGFLKTDNSLPVRFCSVPVGAMVTANIFHFISFFGFAGYATGQVFGLFIAAAGTLNFLRLVKFYSELIQKTKLEKFYLGPVQILFGLLSIILLMLSLGPTTAADVLDYHLGSAIEILNSGSLPRKPEWFTARLAGSGESLNAIGLSVGSEQFGSLIQYCSVMGVISLFWGENFKPFSRGCSQERVLSLAVLSCPLMLFLLSGAKPLMWPISMLVIAFFIATHPSLERISVVVLKKRFAMVCFLCASATQVKFNFLLGGGCVGLFALYIMILQKEMKSSLLIAFSTFLVLVLPSAIWKAFNWGGNVFEALFSPLPGKYPGTAEMISLFSKNADTSGWLPFPISIFLPSSIGDISVIIGFSILPIFFLRLKLNNMNLAALLTVGFIFIANTFLAPPSGRVYLEPILLSFVIVASGIQTKHVIFPPFLHKIIYAQTVCVLLIASISSIYLFSGSLNVPWRDAVMRSSANGYSLMKWVDKVLPQDAVLLNGHRSMALSPRLAVDYTWVHYLPNTAPYPKAYLDRLVAEGVTHVLLTSMPNNKMPLFNCFEEIIATSGPMKIASRNPFNRSVISGAWLIKFNTNKLHECGGNRDN
ncbi:DUF1420 domain-containing protein [Candidatus Puniceispirillum sp.]|nr:DUF1420 domain-containing protein [Candidatus Puniceispirillum sp.]